MPKVLVVDDEEKIRGLLERFLVKSGFEVTKASGGEEAVSILRSLAPDLVLLDVKMPGMSGADFLKEMRALKKDFPVILLTGSIDAEKNLSSLRELGFYEENICYKPVDLFSLLTLIKKKLNIA